MERRYLAAILSMAATFAVVSQGLQSGLVDRYLQQKPDLVSELKCATRAVGAKLLAQINPNLRPEDLDAARLLARLNVFGTDAAPVPKPQAIAEPVQIRIEAAAAQTECPEMQKAQEKALRSAQRLQHRMERMQARLEQAQTRLAVNEAVVAQAVALQIPSEAEINRQVEISVRSAQAQAIKAQKAAFANAGVEMGDLQLQAQGFKGLHDLPVVRTVVVERQLNRTKQHFTNGTEQKKSYEYKFDSKSKRL